MKAIMPIEQELESNGKTPRVQQVAFSLVEMMVVVAVIGILVTLALPRFRTFVAKARMGEAIHNLGIVDRLQKSYHVHYQMLGHDDVWYSGDLMGNGSTVNNCQAGTAGVSLQNKLGFRVEDCGKLRYDYSGSANVDTALNTEGHQRIYPGCYGSGKNDEWKLRRVTSGGTGKIDHTKDIIEQCK